jgi:hypothetical protein
MKSITAALAVSSRKKSRVSAKPSKRKTDWIRAMSFRNFGFASRDLKVYWFRQTRTSIARQLITCGNRLADLAEWIAPWLRSGNDRGEPRSVASHFPNSNGAAEITCGINSIGETGPGEYGSLHLNLVCPVDNVGVPNARPSLFGIDALSQRLAAAARRERQQRFERSAISRVHDVVELPVDKTQRYGPPIVPEPEPEAALDAIPDWVERQKRNHMPWFSIVELAEWLKRREYKPWFSIEEEIEPNSKIYIDDIQRAVCKYFGVSHIDLISARRTVADRSSATGRLLPRQNVDDTFIARDRAAVRLSRPYFLPEWHSQDTQLRVTDEALNKDIVTITASLGGSIA